MKIRSVTLFTDTDQDPAQFAPFLNVAREAFPVPVQTCRAATPPFPDWWAAGMEPASVTAFAQEFAAAWTAVGMEYIALGPVQLHHPSHWLEMIPDLLNATDQLFCTVEIADRQGQIDLARAQNAARLIRQVSTLQENGFGNLYLTILANCPPGSPFFPVAFHHGGAPHFALAVESADLALQAIAQSNTLEEAQENLIQTIENAAGELAVVAKKLSAQFDLPFSGIDFSLAPFPTAAQSLGGALEALGVPQIGGAGSLFAAGFVTAAIDQADFPRCGFSGLMLPVLEDSVLAQRAAEGVLELGNLLSYSAVCGVGLDTVPLPGDVTAGELTAVLLDLAMLATRLDKPLTARLMPLPGLHAGDPVQFDFPFFADGGVMDLSGSGVQGLLRSNERLHIPAIRQRSEGS